MKTSPSTWLAALIGFAWGGIVIGWWITYPLAVKLTIQECKEFPEKLKIPREKALNK